MEPADDLRNEVGKGSGSSGYLGRGGPLAPFPKAESRCGPGCPVWALFYLSCDVASLLVQVLQFNTNCPECNAPAKTNMKVVRILFRCRRASGSSCTPAAVVCEAPGR